MRVIVDITHPAHINLFKHIIRILRTEGNEVMVVVLDRGKIISITEKEIPEAEILIIGKWYKSHFKKIFYSNILRSLKLFFKIVNWKPDIAISSGSIPLGFACKLNGIPNIQISDDPERILSSRLEVFVSTKKYYPPFVKIKNKKTDNYNCLKQWAYLTPKIFIPNEEVLNEYSISKKNYLFVRDISVKSLNYNNQSTDILVDLIPEFPEEIKVLLSLEDKTKRNNFPTNWIILNEPVKDIHSLMYFSKIVISTGDSMVREGALLGVPSIYLGKREMAANKVLIEKKMLFQSDSSTFKETFKNIIVSDFEEKQESFRIQLLNEWDDLNDFMMRKLNEFKK